MALPARAVGRPVTVLMATLAVATFGVLSALRLPVELLPDLSYPTLTIQTEYPDAAPVTVEQFVTRPIEEAVGVIPGVRSDGARSVSRAGLSEVILEFNWDEDMDGAALSVREKLALVELPRQAERPRVLRFDPSLDPIVRLALGGQRPLDDLYDLADRWLKPRLEAVQGVAAARVRGGLEPEIQVEADQRRLAALSLTLSDLASAIEAEGVNQPGGVLKDFNAVYLVRTLHEFEDLEQIRRTVVRETDRGRVRVEDVANVRRGHRDRDIITRMDGTEVVEIDIHREGSANTVAVAKALRQELAAVREEMADDLELTVLSDQSRYIDEAVGEVWKAAWLGGILAVLVLYFFLRDVVSTTIIAITIPVSVVATFLPMLKAGVTLNIMSLGGLALGVGMLVDNSVVVLEAIDRRRREGRSRREAAIMGASEVAGAVTAATLTTVAVFMPIVFVKGIAGQLFYDQAVTVCLSLLASLLVSLTLIPALAALDLGALTEGGSTRTLFRWDAAQAPGTDPPWTLRLGGLTLRPVGDGRHFLSRLLTLLLAPLRLLLLLVVLLLGGVAWLAGWAFHVIASPFARSFEALGRAYPRVLVGALRLRWAVVGLALVLFLGSLAMLGNLGTNLVPDLSQGEFAFRLRLPEGTPLETTAELVARLEDPLLAEGRYARVFSVVGSLPSAASGQQTYGENLAQLNVVLASGTGAEEEALAVERVRRLLALYPELDAELVRPSVLSVKPAVAVRIHSDDLDALDVAARQVAARLETLAGVEDVATSSEPGSPEIRVVLDRERAAPLGLTASSVGRVLRHQIRGEIPAQFREGEKRLDIRVRADEPWRRQALTVDELPVRLPGGKVVPVSAVARVELDRGPGAIHRSSGSRVAWVTARARASDLGRVLGEVRSELRALTLPGGVVAEPAGQDAEMNQSFASLRLALALAVFLVYVVMASQFESLLHPLVILLSVPLGVVGVVAALWITGRPISVLVLIGSVMLAGIVVNNAIVLIDAVNRRRRREGQALDEAIVAAGRERLRPILMTTTTTVLALLPMALGLGAGDELRSPLAITVIGGLVVATGLTLLVVPCVYRLLARRDAGVEAPTGVLETEG